MINFSSYIKILPIFLICLLSNAYAQEFGCYNIPVDNNQWSNTYTRTYRQRLDNIKWEKFNINEPKDGEYIEYFERNKYFPDVLKMKGEIKNGLKTGIWYYYIQHSTGFFSGDYVKGKKEGLWKEYYIGDKVDTICVSQAEFKDDKLEGKKTEYWRDQVSKTTEYKNGLKHGMETEYRTNDTSNVNYIHNIAHYFNGKLDGINISYSEAKDTLQYEIYNNGKKNGRCKYFHYKGGIARVIDFKNDTLDGLYVYYDKKGKIIYKIECKNNLPYTALLAFDTNGTKLNPGTLKNGNGTLNFFYENGQLKSSMEYKNQLINGKFVHNYKRTSYHPDDKNFHEKGYIYCDTNKVYSKVRSYTNISDFNMLSAWQQNFSEGTDYMQYYENGKIHYKVKFITSDSLDTNFLLAEGYAENGNKIHEEKEIFKLTVDEEKRYFDNGWIKQIGNYSIIDNDSTKESVKNGKFKYYYQNGTLRAEVTYSNGKEIGQSFFYDDSGNLVRVREIRLNGSEMNILYGDTVNITDSNGLKQGKWVSFPDYYNTDNNCFDQPNIIKFYKDDKPIGTWKYYDSRNNVLLTKFVWKDPIFSEYYRYNSNGQLLEQGFMLKGNTRTGLWKMYDGKKGVLRFKGKYEYGEQNGTWLELRKNGKVKKEVQYKNGEIVTNELKHSSSPSSPSDVNKSYNYDNVKEIKRKDIKKANEIAQSWLNEKSDSLEISKIELENLIFNPDEGTMQIVDMYEEGKDTLSDKRKTKLINEIEEAGFYFINGSYLNTVTNKKHSIQFIYNLDKKICYVYITETESKEIIYMENLINWNWDK